MDRKNKLWLSAIDFLVSQYLGEDAAEQIFTYTPRHFASSSLEKTGIQAELNEYEKVLYNFLDLFLETLRQNETKMTMGDLNAKRQIFEGLDSLFWGTIKMNRPEISAKQGLVIMEGYQIVEVRVRRQNPFSGMALISEGDK